MSSVLLLNPFIKELHRDPETDDLVLQNLLSSGLIKLNSNEYEIISLFARYPDLEDAFNVIHQSFEATQNDLLLLRNKAIDLQVLVEPSQIDQLKKDYTKKGVKRYHWQVLEYVLVRFFELLKKYVGVHLQVELRGGFYLFKICSLNVEHSWIRKVALNRFIQIMVISLGIFSITACTGYLIVNMTQLRNLNFLSSAYQSSFSPSVTFWLLLVAILSSYVIHEGAHYLLYKRYGGVTDRFGFAFMFVIIPIVYTAVDSIYFWKNKASKIKVSLAGIVADLAMLLLSLCLLLMPGMQHFSFTLIIFSIFIGFRLIGNLNAFIPGTDGYFVMIDLLNKENFFEEVTYHVKQGWKHLKKMELKNLVKLLRTYKWQYIYFLLAICWISVYWILIAATIFMPFYL